MESNSGIIYGYFIDDGLVKPVKDYPLDTFEYGKTGFIWLHLDKNNANVRAYIENKENISKSLTEELLSNDTRPLIFEYDEGMTINLRGLNLNPNKDAADMIFLHMWIEKREIITIRDEKFMTMKDINDAYELEEGPKSIEEFIISVIENLTLQINNYVNELIDEVDEIEDLILDNENKSVISRISSLRRKIIQIKRYLSPQKEVLKKLSNNRYDFLGENIKNELMTLEDRNIRIIEELDLIRERSILIQEEINNKNSYTMNKTMYILSIIGAIFLPLSFLTGLLGVNLSGIPGSENELSFIVFAIAIAVIALFEYILFKRNKWL